MYGDMWSSQGYLEIDNDLLRPFKTNLRALLMQRTLGVDLYWADIEVGTNER